MDNFPIGVLDSGLGGLTIASEIKKLLPREQIIYFGDSKNAPYSKRRNTEISELSNKIINFLLKKNVKIIVVACNTITVTCLEDLRKVFKHVPIIGTVPVIKTAVQITENGSVGIFSTKRTAESTYQKKLINKFAKGMKVLSLGSDDIVPKIENGESVSSLLKKELAPFKQFGVDVLALGCTHFPLVKEDIGQIMGSSVKVIDSGAAVARQVKRIIEKNKTKDSVLKDLFFTTGNAQIMKEVLNKLGLSGEISSIDLK